MTRLDQARWYAVTTVLSVLAMAFLGVAQLLPRLGYPVGFVFTMFGVFAVIRPTWSQNPDGRARLVAMGSGAFLTQAAVLWLGMSASAS